MIRRLFLLAILLFPGAGFADTILSLLPADSVTHHKLNGLAYTATAGTLPLRDEKGDRAAAIFFVAYTREGPPAAKRPVSFFFNGGPGAASAYLHLGAAGPQVLDFENGARLKDNPDSWLPFTDMVFIDAIGAGWSRAANAEDKSFFGVRQDAQVFAKAVALWLQRQGRAVSPKYLVGESYGGLRSVKVARDLQHDQGILVDGVIMISPLLSLDFFDTADNPLADALLLPSLAAAALERRHAFAADAVEDAYRFALGDYLTTMVGPAPSKAFYEKLGALAGIPAAVAERLRGKIDTGDHDVRSQNGRLLSLYDATVTVPDPFPEGTTPEPDPVLDGFTRAYGGAFAGYAATTLGFHTELTYKLLAMDVNEKWDWRNDGHGGIADLRRLLALNPNLKVFIAHGLFDLVCPFAASRWLVEHLPVGSERVALKTYPGGHMLYSRAASRAALTADVRKIY